MEELRQWNGRMFSKLVEHHSIPGTHSTSAWVMLTNCRATVAALDSDFEAVVTVLATHVDGIAVIYTGAEPPEGVQRVEWLTPGVPACDMDVARAEPLGDRIWRVELRVTVAAPLQTR